MGYIKYNTLADAYLIMASAMMLSVIHSLLMYYFYPVAFFIFALISATAHRSFDDIDTQRLLITVVSISILISIITATFSIIGLPGLVHLSQVIVSVILFLLSNFVRLTRSRHLCLSNFIISGILAIYFIPVISLVIASSLTTSILAIIIATIMSAFFAYSINQSLVNYPTCSSLDLVYSSIGLFDYHIKKYRY